MSTTDEFLAGSGAKAFAFGDVGDTISGTVTAVDKRQMKEYDSERLEVWPDGAPKFTWIFQLDTADGPQAIYVRGNMFTAVRSAAAEAGISEMIGAKLSVRFDSLGEPSKKGFHPPKLFKAKWEPAPAASASAEDLW